MFLATFLLFTEIPREFRKSLNTEIEKEEEEDISIADDEAEDVFTKKNISKNPCDVDFTKLDDEERDRLSKLNPSMKGVIVSLLIFVIIFNGFAVQETITTPISTDITHKYTTTLDYPESFAYILFA